MRFAVDIGELETNHLEYEFNQLTGSLLITVNNHTVKQSVRWFNEPIREIHDLMVGQQERSRVRIEKERGVLFGQRNRVYVNNRLTSVFEGV